MTMKGPSRKQIIVPMNNKNNLKFMEASSAHITNLNKALKNIKLEVIADFIHSEQAGIFIVTNKVASSLNLQTIERYIKSSNNIDAKNVEVLCLP